VVALYEKKIVFVLVPIQTLQTAIDDNSKTTKTTKTTAATTTATTTIDQQSTICNNGEN
jgi:hypothetical protein